MRFFAAGLFLSAIMFSQLSADELTPRPAPAPATASAPACGCDAPAKDRLSFLTSSCVCAVYPVWDDGNGNYLYMAEVCTPEPACEITDTVYYWESLLDYPQTCDTTQSNPSGSCSPCTPVSTFYGAAVTTPFPGMKRKASKASTAATMFPDRVPPKTNPGHPEDPKADRPRFGIISEMGIIAKFEANWYERPVTTYAKVMIVVVDPELARSVANGNRPSTGSQRRLVTVGYEIDPSEITANDIVIDFGKSRPAPRKLQGGGIESPQNYTVQEVRKDLMRFLVIMDDGIAP